MSDSVFKALKGKREGRLGTPPAPSSVKNNLDQPETLLQAPSDGRSLRATGRTEQFATRLTPGIRKRIKEIALREDSTMGEVIERAIAMYDRKNDSS